MPFPNNSMGDNYHVCGHFKFCGAGLSAFVSNTKTHTHTDYTNERVKVMLVVKNLMIKQVYKQL